MIGLLPLLTGSGIGACLADDPPAFEVASVKASAPPPTGGRGFHAGPRMNGGPGSGDPTRIDYTNVSMTNLVSVAYGVEYWQVTGPDSMSMNSYDITARVPPATTREEFLAMLRNLLAERFRLQAHHEPREVSLYSLVIAKGGARLRPHVEKPATKEGGEPAADAPQPLRRDPDGYPILTRGMTMAVSGGKARLGIENKDIGWLVGQLSAQLGGPVKDDTGLTGHYDFALFWSARPHSPQTEAEGGPDLIEAVQGQLGLKLERKKGPIDYVVVDHVERVPSGN